MNTYRISLVGLSPLLMHADNIDWAESLKKWRSDPDNRKLSVAGDDRSPAHTWLGSLYHDGKFVGIPSDNLMRCLMEGGTGVPVPGGRGGKTFKAQTQSGILINDPLWPIVINGLRVSAEPLLKLTAEKDFEKHQAAAIASGFQLYVKRASVNQSKHVRVRPRFESWKAEGTLTVMDEQITTSILKDILRQCGTYKGLGDWRPSSKTPGWFGRFQATVEEV